jgi:hypothetical protein
MRRQLAIVSATFAALVGLYALVFALSDNEFNGQSIWSAVANAGPAVLIGWLIATRIAPALWPVRHAAAIFGIVATLIAYAVISYVLTIVLLALGGGGNSGEGGLFIRYFTGPAFIWQSFQGLAYGLISLLTGWLLHSEQLRLAVVPDTAMPAPLGRLLLRTEAGIVPVEAAEILRIAAADDYCEVVLATVRHLARMSLSECERLLANEPILRVHRSHLINLRHMASAEPTGDGRLQLTLNNGDRLTTSRAGARLIRDHCG